MLNPHYPATSPVQYFQRSLCIPRMDHLVAQMGTYFSESQVNVSKQMCLVPEVLMSSSDITIDAEIQFYRDDHQMSLTLSLACSFSFANGQK